MLLTPMRYKSYIWPHNPAVYSITYQRQVAAHKVPFGRYCMQDLGLTCRDIIFDTDHILDWLAGGNPIICAMRPGDFTTTGHFIVLAGVDEDGKVEVCDPNSPGNSERTWAVEELIPQIKNLWAYQFVS